ncbi:MAG TPA: hypothetical protein PK006_12600 [Saprospiraceae bacterium]|nr:hypothetical protein [Saprospiraceae bacterium]
MKYIINTLVLIVTLSSCASYFPSRENFIISSVEVTSKGKTISKIDNNSTNSFTDSILSIELMPYTRGFKMKVANNYNGSIFINWDKSVISYKRSYGKLIHDGVRCINRDFTVVPTTLIKGDRIEDFAVPANSVYWKDSYSKKLSGEWEVAKIFPLGHGGKKIALNYLNEINSNKLKLGLFVENGVNSYEYIFTGMFSSDKLTRTSKYVDYYYILDFPKDSKQTTSQTVPKNTKKQQSSVQTAPTTKATIYPKQSKAKRNGDIIKSVAIIAVCGLIIGFAVK